MKLNTPWRRDGYYIVRPSAKTLLDCEFIASDTEPSLRTLQELVGGYIEVVTVKLICDGIVNEEGKLRGLPPNPLATELYENRWDSIVGTMVICCGKARLT